MSEKRPYPQHYIEYAIQFHRAGKAIITDLDEATRVNPQLAVSIGLFLQSIELCGKSILRSIGISQRAIRKGYANHDVYELMRDAQDAVAALPISGLENLSSFLDHDVPIFAYSFRDNLGELLKHLSERNQAGKPRNYFYPDHPTFAALKPPGLNIAIEQMTHRLIKDSSEIARVLGWDEP